MVRYYKIFESRGNAVTFLYHRCNGNRQIPLGQWVTAERKWVKEGSNPYYWSGFHIYPDLEAVAKWTHRVRRFENRFCVAVLAREVTKKPTRGEAYLAQQLCLTPDDWANRIPLSSVGS